MEGGREEEREGGREGGREEGRKRGRERERKREGEREGERGREGEREREREMVCHNLWTEGREGGGNSMYHIFKHLLFFQSCLVIMDFYTCYRMTEVCIVHGTVEPLNKGHTVDNIKSQLFVLSIEVQSILKL